jgi:hypothetical protein
MVVARLPEAGELRLGAITLPAGRRVGAGVGSGGPLAWITGREVPDAGRAWAALSRAQPDTGLVPFLLSGLDGTAERPWDREEFADPADVSELDSLDVTACLRDLWDDLADAADEDDDAGSQAYLRAKLGPFTRQFPGLAPPEDQPLSRPALDEVLGALPAARIGLVPARRPADVLPLAGWEGVANWHATALPVAAVLRSWEDRFGARLLEVGFDGIRVLAERPPRTLRAAEHLAAEHVVFCDECGGRGLTEVARVAAALLDSPVWTFWWDQGA